MIASQLTTLFASSEELVSIRNTWKPLWDIGKAQEYLTTLTGL